MKIASARSRKQLLRLPVPEFLSFTMSRLGLRANLTLCLVLAFSAGANAQKPVSKTILAYSSFNMPAAMVWIAKEDRIFAKNAINEELILIPGGTTAMSALISGNIHFAQLTGSPGAFAYLGGADVVYLAASMDTMSYQIVVKPEIRTASDLKGKRIGISRFGSSPDVAVRLALRKLGLNPETDVAFLQTGGSPERLAALLGNKVDATVLNAPFDRVSQKQNLRILADTSKMGLSYFDTGIVTTRRLTRNNEDIVRQFMRAYVEAIKVFKTNKSRTLAIAARYTHVSDVGALEEAYNYFVDKIPRYPYPTIAGMQTVLNELARTNPKAGSVKPEELIDARFVRELQNSGFIDNLYK
jgi:NitT/TauT family transport system substrate-binding protein